VSAFPRGIADTNNAALANTNKRTHTNTHRNTHTHSCWYCWLHSGRQNRLNHPLSNMPHASYRSFPSQNSRMRGYLRPRASVTQTSASVTQNHCGRRARHARFKQVCVGVVVAIGQVKRAAHSKRLRSKSLVEGGWVCVSPDVNPYANPYANSKHIPGGRWRATRRLGRCGAACSRGQRRNSRLQQRFSAVAFKHECNMEHATRTRGQTSQAHASSTSPTPHLPPPRN